MDNDQLEWVPHRSPLVMNEIDSYDQWNYLTDPVLLALSILARERSSLLCHCDSMMRHRIELLTTRWMYEVEAISPRPSSHLSRRDLTNLVQYPALVYHLPRLDWLDTNSDKLTVYSVVGTTTRHFQTNEPQVGVGACMMEVLMQLLLLQHS